MVNLSSLAIALLNKVAKVGKKLEISMLSERNEIIQCLLRWL